MSKKTVTTLLLCFVFLRLLLININSYFPVMGDELFYFNSVYALHFGFVDNNNHPLLAKTVWYLTSYILFGITGQGHPVYFRIGSIFMSFLGLAFFYKCCTLFSSAKISLLATLILATDPMYFEYSRVIQLDIVYVSLMCGFLYFFFKYLSKPSGNNLIYSAVMLGLSVAAKYASLPLVIVAPFFISFTKHPKRIIFTLLFIIVFFLSVILGNLIFFFKYHGSINIVHYLLSIITNQLTMTHHNPLQYTPAWSWFIHPKPIPLLNQVIGYPLHRVFARESWPLFLSTFPILIISAMQIFRSWKKLQHLTFLLTSFLVLYLPWFFTRHGTFYYYILPLIPVKILLLILLTRQKYTLQKIIITGFLMFNLFYLAINFPIFVGT